MSRLVYADAQLSSPVHLIAQDAGGVRVSTPAGDYEARAGIVTIPPGVLRQVGFEPPLSAAQRAATAESHAGTGIKVWAVVGGAAGDFFAVGRAPGIDIAWTYAQEKDGNLVVGFGAGAGELDPSDREEVERAFRAYLPDAELLRCTGHDWTADPDSLGTWPSFRPGQITRHEKALAQREGRISFAGSETAQRWPSYIEGAIESGYRAAAETAKTLATDAETRVR